VSETTIELHPAALRNPWRPQQPRTTSRSGHQSKIQSLAFDANTNLQGRLLSRPDAGFSLYLTKLLQVACMLEEIGAVTYSSEIGRPHELKSEEAVVV
jgi:hypothetical protein